MPATRTAAEIADFALREVGAFAPTDTAADPNQKQIALMYYDMMMSELAGMDGIWWLRPISQIVPLTAGVYDYDLNSLLTTRLESFERAFRVTSTNTDGREIDLLTKEDYERRHGDNSTGVTDGIYISRGINPHMFTYPTPATPTTDQIRLYGQTYTIDMTGNGGNVPHSFPPAWQLWMIKSLAAKIGAGPVARLPAAELKKLEDDAADKLAILKTMSNRQNLSRPLLQEPDEMASRGNSSWGSGYSGGSGYWRREY